MVSDARRAAALQALSTSTPMAEDDLGDLTADELKECLKEQNPEHGWEDTFTRCGFSK